MVESALPEAGHLAGPVDQGAKRAEPRASKRARIPPERRRGRGVQFPMNRKAVSRAPIPNETHGFETK